MFSPRLNDLSLQAFGSMPTGKLVQRKVVVVVDLMNKVCLIVYTGF